MQKNLIIISILAAVLMFTACEPHRIDIQQGNQVKPENYAMLKIGMSRKQVVFLLGSPLLKDAFHQHRWDYIYYLKPGNNPVLQSRVTLIFDGDKLIKIDNSEYTPEVYQNRKEDNPLKAPLNSGGGGGGHSH